MVETRNKQATLPIDKFLGVLALMDLESPTSAISYTTPVEDCFQRIASNALRPRQ